MVLPVFSAPLNLSAAKRLRLRTIRATPPLPPDDQEDKVNQRKERRAKLGEDLLSVSGDVPFKFPATFTFVFRAFTSLDGIGKGLDNRRDSNHNAKDIFFVFLKTFAAGVVGCLRRNYSVQ